MTNGVFNRLLVDPMIHVIRMHSVKSMNERRNIMKQRNVTGVRTVSVISKAMLLLNMHSKSFPTSSSIASYDSILSVCDHLKDEETAARAYMEFIRTQELRQVRQLVILMHDRIERVISGEEFY